MVALFLRYFPYKLLLYYLIQLVRILPGASHNVVLFLLVELFVRLLSFLTLLTIIHYFYIFSECIKSSAVTGWSYSSPSSFNKVASSSTMTSTASIPSCSVNVRTNVSITSFAITASSRSEERRVGTATG